MFNLCNKQGNAESIHIFVFLELFTSIVYVLLFFDHTVYNRNLLEVLVPRLEKGGEVLSSSDFQTINLSETSKPTKPKEKESKCSC